jgi:hypothetical protein
MTASISSQYSLTVELFDNTYAVRAVESDVTGTVNKHVLSGEGDGDIIIIIICSSSSSSSSSRTPPCEFDSL